MGRNHTGEDRGVKCGTEKGWRVQVIILTWLGWEHSNATVVVIGYGINGWFFLDQEALRTFYTLGNDLVMREKEKKKTPDKAERKDHN